MRLSHQSDWGPSCYLLLANEMLSAQSSAARGGPGGQQFALSPWVTGCHSTPVSKVVQEAVLLAAAAKLARCCSSECLVVLPVEGSGRLSCTRGPGP